LKELKQTRELERKSIAKMWSDETVGRVSAVKAESELRMELMREEMRLKMELLRQESAARREGMRDYEGQLRYQSRV
jgi:hypothetical protein